ncbi:unnamed protein product [Rangifer tarandus platyrhynchus]|uniref:Uncharacterized protein n=1 Tax=Rangifer tarandus platyrhynchus TaxID=3082113 RepID=A0AC59YM53_RANTA
MQPCMLRSLPPLFSPPWSSALTCIPPPRMENPPLFFITAHSASLLWGLILTVGLSPSGREEYGMTTCKVAILKEPSQIPQINIETRCCISILEESIAQHHRLNGHEFEQAQGDGEGQGSLECCSPWGHKDWTRLSD